MQNLSEIAPILGAYNSSVAPPLHPKASMPSRSFGNRVNARYATQMSSGVLQWTSEKQGSALALSPKGRVDETSADAFKDYLVDAVGTESATVVIDLSAIEYMSSRGLRGLTLAQRAANEGGTTIVLACPNETMRDMVFRVADTIEDAIGN